ncbi:hydroxymethylbilane synthase [Stieleria sp. ICT_E10.1]|uniref:hydroxymethylbilane synthase n=1 Tax=Stieleria sedimenti TaxID=2976331 RepID=UPI00217FC1D0|nr:hydroxymethylbilane synthase [Stieleria sedimenti]MCS7465674.1 hydroxymethylbilane synthase [Stieleria sedimenti]
MPAPDPSSLSDRQPSDQPAGQSDPRVLRIATRESPLALWQARHVAQLLAKHTVAPRIVPMVSGGDVDMRPIDGKRSVGVFTKRIQQALLDDEGDVAVHSMKDLPTEAHPSLRMVASPARETVADCLVSPRGGGLDALPHAARIGTGSRRRAAQLLKLRPDLDVQPIRGNVQTRLQKMRDGEYDAIVLAAAGIERLEMHDLPRVQLPLEHMLPAPGQGALAIEVRGDDTDAVAVVSQLNVPRSTACTLAERTLLSQLHGGCLAPIAALGTVSDVSAGEETRSVLHLVARVLSLDGKVCLESEADTTLDLASDDWQSTAIALGRQVAEMLIDQGAKPLIEAGR